MHKPDQPQTTHTATSRDAAAQIGVEKLDKAELIIRGLEIEFTRKYPTEDARYMDGVSLGKAAIIIESLTSPSKEIREYAKTRVRELVKLGKGE